MTRLAIGLGSNEGERLDHLVSAVAEIGELVDDEYRVSSLYETEPVGGPEQDPFLNAVMVVDTGLEPLQLLDELQRIEKEHGRERKVRWGPRTLDLDILATDGPVYDDDRLTVPHPRAQERGFVLAPLVDVWPDAPVGPDLTAGEALRSTGTDGVDRLSRNWLPPAPRLPVQVLIAGQFVLIVLAALALAADGQLPEGEVTVLSVSGAVLAMTGLVLAFISSRRLGPRVTPSPVPREGARLVVSGPYRYARHPIYGGVVLVFLGTALFLDSLFGVGAAVLALIFFWIKSIYEEKQLRMRFTGYSRYQEAVQRRLIPFVV